MTKVRRESGQVLAVNSVTAGSEVVSYTLGGAGDTTWNGARVWNDAVTWNGISGTPQGTLTVADPTDFDDLGGVLVVNDETLPYDTVNRTTGAITLGYVTDETGNPTPAVFAATPEEGDPVDVFDPIAGAVAQHVVAHIAVEGADFQDDALEVVVDHALIPHLPEGIRESGEGEVVTVEWRDGWPSVVDLQDQAVSLASPSGGWSLSPEAVEFEDVAVLGTLGASAIAADTITLGDADLAEQLDAPAGLVAYANVATGTNTANITSAAPTVLFIFSAGVLRAGRRYLVLCQFQANGDNAGDEFDWRLGYDPGGAKPSTASPGTTVDGSQTRWVTPPGTYRDNNAKVMGFLQTESTWGAISNGAPIYLGLFAQRIAGTGGVTIAQNVAARSLQLVVLDVGSTATPVTNSWAQKSKVTADPPDDDPPTDYTTQWAATDSRSYDGDGGRRAGDENTTSMYQGYYSSVHGNQRSVFTLNSSAIQSALSGATITRVRLKFRVKHSYYNSGMKIRFRTCSNSSAPSTWAGISGRDNEVTKNNAKASVTYTIDLPLAVGRDFKSGAAKGFIVGPGATSSKTHYGYLYGAGTGSAPKLIIDYEK